MKPAAPIFDGTEQTDDDGGARKPRRWTRVVGAGAIVVGLGWFVPARNFVDVALGLVGIAAVLWRPVS